MPDTQENKGVSLSRSQWDRIQKQAKRHKVSIHAITKYLTLYGLQELESGNFKIKVEKVSKLINPGD